MPSSREGRCVAAFEGLSSAWHMALEVFCFRLVSYLYPRSVFGVLHFLFMSMMQFEYVHIPGTTLLDEVCLGLKAVIVKVDVTLPKEPSRRYHG